MGGGEPCDDAAARVQQSGNELQLHGNMGMRLKSINKQANTAAHKQAKR